MMRSWSKVWLALGWLTCTAAAEPLAPITKEVTMAAPPAEVFRAFATGEGLNAAVGIKAAVELRPGGAYEWYFSDEAPEGARGGEGNRILCFIQDRMLAFSWNAPPSFPAERARRTFVVLEFEDADGGSRVRLTHGGWPDGAEGKWSDVHAYFDRAWGGVLAKVAQCFRENAGRLPEPTAAAPAPPAWEHYTYFIRPVREGLLTEATPEEQKAIGEHVQYIIALEASGRLVLAGPCHGELQKPTASEKSVCFEMEAPGIVVFRAHDAADAKSIMENDPAVLAGVFKGTVVRYHAAFGAK